ALVRAEEAVEVEAGEQTSRATFGLESGGPYLDFGITRPLAPWLDLTLGARSGAAAAEEALHEGSAVLRATTTLPAVGGSSAGQPAGGASGHVTGRLAGEAFFAVTALVPARGLGIVDATPSVFGTRMGAAAEARLASPVTPVGT